HQRALTPIVVPVAPVVVTLRATGGAPTIHNTTPPASATPPAAKPIVETVPAVDASVHLSAESRSGQGSGFGQRRWASDFFESAFRPKIVPTAMPASPAAAATSATTRTGVMVNAE